MTRKNVLITALIVTAILAAAGTTAFFLWPQGETFAVTFKNSKQLQPGARVYLSGIDIGEVKSVELVNGNINVTVRLAREHKGRIPRTTMFYIDTDQNAPKEKCILAKVTGRAGESIKDGDILEGTDSFLAWKMSEVADQVRDSIDSPQVRQLLQDLERFVNDFNEVLNDIDWDQLEEDLRQQAQSLIEDIDQAIRSEEVQQGLEELEDRIDRIQRALVEVGESEEARRLHEALEGLYNRLDEELRKAEPR
ncbi:MAG: MlaD family protein [Desulfobacterales bacterium]|nr:MlaD family protein [Desulfobacterales bacterium]